MYPNPNESGKLKVSSGKGPLTIKLIDAIGKIIYQVENAYGLTEVDLSPFGKGIYMIFVTTNNRSFTTKVIFN